MADSNPPLKRFTHLGRLSLTSIAEALGQVPPDQPVLICADELIVDCNIDLQVRSLDLHVRVLVCQRRQRSPLPVRTKRRPGGYSSDGSRRRIVDIRLALHRTQSASRSGSRKAARLFLRFTPADETEASRIEVSELAELPGDPLVLISVLQAARSCACAHWKMRWSGRNGWSTAA